MASRRPLRVALTALAALVVGAAATGCVSMANGGPVMSYGVTQGAGGQSQNFPRFFAQPPGSGWDPQEIVQGFLTASASFGDRQLAKRYLTGPAAKSWPRQSWGAIVYSDGPNTKPPVGVKKDSHGQWTEETVTVTGVAQADLASTGSYAVNSAKQPGPQVFTLVKAKGQWRISKAPEQLLLANVLFQDDYQLRNLYFFDPNGRVLVPDPVYVPLQATPSTLLNGLVNDLIRPPNPDWLSSGGATRSAFPGSTQRIGDVTLDGGTATVNLRGPITKASAQVLRQASAQLFWTLTGTGQSGLAVQSVQLNLNGKPWTPPGQDNPVQRAAAFGPAAGATKTFYYLDHAGNLIRRDGVSAKPVRVAKIGGKVSQLEVSPNGKSVAVLRGGTLLVGQVGGKLVKQPGTEYLTMSWAPQGNLWAAQSGQIVMFPAGRQSGQQPLDVSVLNNDDTVNTGTFSGLRVAPDGVRVAVVVNGTRLNFGAIAAPPSSTPARLQLNIQLSPFYVQTSGKFASLTWYGPDNVITLSQGDKQQPPVVTEYPVSGGMPTSIQGVTGMTSVTASAGYPVIAGLSRGGLMTGGSLSGAWAQLTDGTVPVTGTLPSYAGP